METSATFSNWDDAMRFAKRMQFDTTTQNVVNRVNREWVVTLPRQSFTREPTVTLTVPRWDR